MTSIEDLLPRYKIALVREPEAEAVEYPRFLNSQQLFLRFREELSAYDRETFFVITLDSKNRTIGCHKVSVGSLSASVVHPREVFKPAILENAASVLCLHNHPSGDPAPSREDRECTRRIFEAGRILGIRLLDHVVFGEGEFFSFADAGLLVEKAEGF